VAWNAQVMPLRVLGVGGGTDADIMDALRLCGRPVTDVRGSRRARTRRGS
jgi:hypothetical protein